jgi:hypothetical protein
MSIYPSESNYRRAYPQGYSGNPFSNYFTQDTGIYFQNFNYGNSYPGNGYSNCCDGGMENYFGNLNTGNGYDSFDSPPTKLVAAGESARMWGDPHIEDADGGKYDFNEHGVFNLLNDRGVNLNAKLGGKEGGPTYIQQAGLVINNRNIRVDPDGKVMINQGENGQDVELKDGETRQLGDGSYITKNGNIITAGTPEYKMEFETNKEHDGNRYMDVKVSTKDGGVMLDGQKPAGMLGETFDEDKEKQTALREKGDFYKRNNLFETGQGESCHPHGPGQTEGPGSPEDMFPPSPGSGSGSPYGQNGCYGNNHNWDPPRCGGGMNQAQIMNQIKQLLQQLQLYCGGSFSQPYADNAQGFY